MIKNFFFSSSQFVSLEYASISHTSDLVMLRGEHRSFAPIFSTVAIHSDVIVQAKGIQINNERRVTRRRQTIKESEKDKAKVKAENHLFRDYF
jgi:hypothetical protein